MIAPVSEFLPLTRDMWMEFQVPSSWPSPSYCRHVSDSVFLSLQNIQTVFYTLINKDMHLYVQVADLQTEALLTFVLKATAGRLLSEL